MSEPIDERIARVAFNADGLVAAIVQQWDTREVLMLGWMDAEALRRTLTEGRVTFWSRSRQEYWRKGDTSGNIQLVRGARLDCDGDAILLQVEQVGPACHTGTRTCFDADDLEPVRGPRGRRVIATRAAARGRRRRSPPARSASSRRRRPGSTVVLDDGAGHTLEVPGASAVPVLAPLSLAVLALGAALSIVGLVLRYLFGALTVAIAVLLGWLTAQVAFTRPTSAVAAHRHRRDRHHRRTPSPTSSHGSTRRRGPSSPSPAGSCCSPPGCSPSPRRTAGGGADAATRRMPVHRALRQPRRASRPHDAIDSWDDLSRGEDPTA